MPVRIVGSYKSFPPGALFPRPALVRIIFGEPFLPTAASATPSQTEPTPADPRDRYEHITREVMDRIRLLAQDS